MIRLCISKVLSVDTNLGDHHRAGIFRFSKYSGMFGLSRPISQVPTVPVLPGSRDCFLPLSPQSRRLFFNVPLACPSANFQPIQGSRSLLRREGAGHARQRN
jgi:hypothetical protein